MRKLDLAREVFIKMYESTFNRLHYLLTLIAFYTYSDIMDSDLKILEAKLAQLISRYQLLFDENKQLRSNLTIAENKLLGSEQVCDQLKERMALAVAKLEFLANQLPEDTSL